MCHFYFTFLKYESPTRRISKWILWEDEKMKSTKMLARTFLQCSKRSILSRKHVVAGVLMLKSVAHRPSSDKCCGWYCWPASHNVAICGSHRGDAACLKEKRKSVKFDYLSYFRWEEVGFNPINVKISENLLSFLYFLAIFHLLAS